MVLDNEIKFIWNNAKDTPYDIDRPVLVQTENNKLMVFTNTRCNIKGQFVSHWQRMVEKYKIKYWIYQSEITEYDRLNCEGYYDD